VKLLHTSDWHVGKKIRGHSRAGEHIAVLEEIASIASENLVDLILVAGDLFETAAPTAESEKIVYKALLDMAEVAPVAVIAGNHDNARRLQAIAPLLQLGRVTMVTEPKSPQDGGVATFEGPDNQVCKLVMLPFVSQRSIVKTESLMSNEAFQNAQTYTHRMAQVIDVMCKGFEDDTINIVMAHAFVSGSIAGGGERAAHIADEYSIGSLAFPVAANYVALGHLHRPQKVQGQTAIHYCGSPLQMDFGESDDVKQVNIIDVAPGLPAKVNPVTLKSGNRLVTITGNMATVAGQAEHISDTDWIKVKLDEPYRVGIADEVKELLGERVVDVKIETTKQVSTKKTRMKDDRSHQDLFKDYLGEKEILDESLVSAFIELYDEVEEAERETDAIDISKSEAMQATLGLFEDSK